MFKTNDAVRWTSSYVDKTGTVLAIVPPGSNPRKLGFDRLGEATSGRDHESYVVRGGPKGGKQALYWPMVSLLSSLDVLTTAEMDWCNRNAPVVRAMMADVRSRNPGS